MQKLKMSKRQREKTMRMKEQLFRRSLRVRRRHWPELRDRRRSAQSFAVTRGFLGARL